MSGNEKSHDTKRKSSTNGFSLSSHQSTHSFHFTSLHLIHILFTFHPCFHPSFLPSFHPSSIHPSIKSIRLEGLTARSRNNKVLSGISRSGNGGDPSVVSLESGSQSELEAGSRGVHLQWLKVMWKSDGVPLVRSYIAQKCMNDGCIVY